jgi:uncharacterized membrane protein YkoI
MTTLIGRRQFLLAVAALLAGGGAAYADDDNKGDDDEGDEDDHDRARRALEEGQARPLNEILVVVEDELGGRIVRVELERRHGRYIYEFRVITPAGELREVYVDAMSAEILKRDGD